MLIQQLQQTDQALVSLANEANRSVLSLETTASSS